MKQKRNIVTDKKLLQEFRSMLRKEVASLRKGSSFSSINKLDTIIELVEDLHDHFKDIFIGRTKVKDKNQIDDNLNEMFNQFFFQYKDDNQSLFHHLLK